MNGDGVHTYFTNQRLQRVVLDATMIDKVKTAFIKKLEKRISN